MSLNVDVSTAVDKLNYKISFWQPLYEAISNSLEANASPENIPHFVATPLRSPTPFEN